MQQTTTVSRGVGEITLNVSSYIGQPSITTNIPLAMPTPFNASQSLNFIVDAPVINLPAGATLGSVQVAPYIRTAFSSALLGASVVGPGLTIIQFFAEVTFAAFNLGTSGTITVSASGSLSHDGSLG